MEGLRKNPFRRGGMDIFWSYKIKNKKNLSTCLHSWLSGADPGFFLGGGATPRNGVTNTNKLQFFLQNTSCIGKL